MLKFPDGRLKDGRLYIVVNIDEAYAEKVFEALRDGERARGRWNEPTGFLEWVFGTWGLAGLQQLIVHSMDPLMSREASALWLANKGKERPEC